MKLRRRLTYRLGAAAFDVALVALVMARRDLGVGLMIGVVAGAITSAIRDHRRAQRAERIDRARRSPLSEEILS